MSLPSNQLDAFVATAKTQSFSNAAKLLNITQSALSQRVQNLELELGSSLFIRGPSSIRLTDLGNRLLRYCQMKDSLEEEFLAEIATNKKNSLGGLIRFGGYSTVVRSLIVPTIMGILKEHSDVQVEFLTKEIYELPRLLDSGEADFILLNKPYEKHGVKNLEMGFEEYVLVEPKKGSFREDVFLDNDFEDRITSDYLKIQKKPIKSWKRSYFDEIYSIIDGVLSGAGRAVVPLHIAKQFDGLKMSKGFISMKSPVYFCYYEQAFYTELKKRVIKEMEHKLPKMLK